MANGASLFLSVILSVLWLYALVTHLWTIPMAPKTRPAVMNTIDPNGDEIVISDSYGNDIVIQVCGSNASRVSIRISGPRELEVNKQPRTRPIDPNQSVTRHPRSPGGGTDARTDATRQA